MIDVLLDVLRAALREGWRQPAPYACRWWYDNGTPVLEGHPWWVQPWWRGLEPGEHVPRVMSPDAIGVTDAMVWAEFVTQHRATAPGRRPVPRARRRPRAQQALDL